MPRRNTRNEERRDKMELPIHRKKTCRFCADKQLRIDYKDAKALKPFITERDRIAPSRITGLCAYHQRRVTEAIKRARIVGIVPFSAIQRQTI
ncbi:MAG: 30S ribosomal protein S18 [Deltaproteobacteria bacterium RIFCSPLOWO2_01_44_7]|nr:MAG: 30S ribosomal protein S18 [Deltaproteobacteria bacterium RIFCSPHIGHO2_01_FULL_43_49]OGQ15907.1 MAG: 30S ribosomal protein S18 [Deltaproteobacteria bacterium RIFCSPHIGHO2_02_FULL_44_53]OGQ28870.1 MAG: 30S ribosomal protein S18 [Deltaproteobacteria bacterium RIFCSPHIGHO2_12_FULL_44_21]OGQ30962.1 MAG: 30S ribosomal protein S18 [Deltaproteobacteria bacterium RIFCSPLOWO2_01_FULL_45_74]OGQ40204.1 MAG: 30S ribosomal protein S18 [Deltaproteobacteria bacterium RIFCSPLOWO2_01_44_7]OGQ43468.1 MAG